MIVFDLSIQPVQMCLSRYFEFKWLLRVLIREDSAFDMVALHRSYNVNVDDLPALLTGMSHAFTSRQVVPTGKSEDVR